MIQELPQAIRSKSPLNYSYITIRMTPSRIKKGLIAIPVPLTEWFPKHNGIINVYLDDSLNLQPKTFSSYKSNTRECRIGGVADWLTRNKIKDGDEIVIQVIDRENYIYRLITEENFIAKTKDLQYEFDSSKSELEASGKIKTIAQWTNIDRQKVVLSEFKRLLDITPIRIREHAETRLNRAKEGVPASIRTLLEDIYKGHCQVCNFWFLKKDSKPYFEVHHLNPLQSHHLKNILVVCGNCHNQFEYANVCQDFNMDDWLVRVSFNDRIYVVNQVALKVKLEDSSKELFI